MRLVGRPDLAKRLVRRLNHDVAAYLRLDELDFPLLAEDVADSRLLPEPLAPKVMPTNGLDIAWICTPPSPGSGGHTTLFRMVQGLHERGHRCTVLLYNRHGADLRKCISVIRQNWPELHASIMAVPDRITDYHACVASSWETAHVLATRGRSIGKRVYFVQDYEPFFYPHGSMYALAEDSYRFGFEHIALGNMTSALLEREIGVRATVVPFGCDTSTYNLRNRGKRSGIAFFARPETDRRGFLLGKLALKQFNERYPDQPITVYGDKIPNWDVPHHYVGHLTPDGLNRLYNQSLAGLAMSFTNISLVAEEMMSSGARAVVNDSPYARADAPSTHILWGSPTPTGIADALSTAVRYPLSSTEIVDMASSVRPGWNHTQGLVATAIEKSFMEALGCQDSQGGKGE